MTLSNEASDPLAGALRLAEQSKLCGRISRDDVQALYELHSKEILAFLIGVLRDPASAQDVLQITFGRLLETDPNYEQGAMKGWLFTVAMREALDFRRRLQRQDRHLRNLSNQPENVALSPDEQLIQAEELKLLRVSLNQLPLEQQAVVRKRIHEEKTFAVIAEELQIPINTVLTRMRLATEKLRKQTSGLK